MFINFKACKISRDARKLARTFTLIKKYIPCDMWQEKLKKEKEKLEWKVFVFWRLLCDSDSTCLKRRSNEAGIFKGCQDQGCQFRFGWCFVFSIGTECFSFGVFRRAVSGLYYIYIYIYIYIYSTNIIQIQDKLIINYAIQTQCQTNIILKFKIFLNNQD